MTAGLPGTPRVGSTFHRRILATILVGTLAIAPARAFEPVPLVLDTTPASAEFAFTAETAEDVVDNPDQAAPEASGESAINESQPVSTVEPAPAEPAAPSVDQVIYKGVVGNLLEAVPLDPEQRVQLQRGNAVLNNAFTGRSVALLLGIASPPLMIVGLVWGIWSAINIKPAQTETRAAIAPMAQPETRSDQTAPETDLAATASSGEQPVADPAQVAAQAGE